MKDTNEKLFELVLCELQKINAKNIKSISFSNKDNSAMIKIRFPRNQNLKAKERT